jgi:hypothetical protein
VWHARYQDLLRPAFDPRVHPPAPDERARHPKGLRVVRPVRSADAEPLGERCPVLPLPIPAEYALANHVSTR